MIYAVVHLDITNPDAIKAYGQHAVDALAKHSGKLEAASTTPSLLEGTAALPDRIALISFPDKDSALAWINDPELQEIHALRRSSGSSNITLIG